MSSFTYFVSQSYLTNNQNRLQCRIHSRVLHLSTLPPKNFSALSPELRSDRPRPKYCIVSLPKGLDSYRKSELTRTLNRSRCPLNKETSNRYGI